ncbi:MAG: hypothetical protein RMJ98_02060 [Myxococcales bacterium]|nr:hypothetical protein [Polyangiaceae bacterium]MDW8248073.1 hypothetical protein [Myxococcales bacterium]
MKHPAELVVISSENSTGVNLRPLVIPTPPRQDLYRLPGDP